jgi:prepilin-type N-terminal cleavage/methylation domain-containing protein
MNAPFRRSGFSFIELLVVITIIGLLISLLLPAVHMAREAARRMSCNRNLAQLILAVHSYQNLHGVYPPGTIADQGPLRNVAKGYHHNWIVQILPHLEQTNAWRRIDHSRGVYDPANAAVAGLTLEVLQCPSTPQVPGQSCFAAVHHDREAPIDVTNNGVFFLNSRVRYEDVTDGTSHTIFLGEIQPEPGGLGWMSGTRATLRNPGTGAGVLALTGALTADKAVLAIMTDLRAEGATGKIDPELVVGNFGGTHGNFAFGDGRVVMLGAAPRVMQLLAHRADGMILDGETH